MKRLYGVTYISRDAETLHVLVAAMSREAARDHVLEDLDALCVEFIEQIDEPLEAIPRRPKCPSH